MASRRTPTGTALTREDLEHLTAHLDDAALAAAIRLIDVQMRSGGTGLSTSEDLRSFLRMRRETFNRVEPQLAGVFDTSSGHWRHSGVDERIRAESRRRERERIRKSCRPDEGEPDGNRPGDCRDTTTADRTRVRDPRGDDAPDAGADAGHPHSGDSRAKTSTARARGGKGSQGSLLPAYRDRRTAIAGSEARAAAVRAPAPERTNDPTATSVLKDAYDIGERVLVQGGQRPEQARRCIGMLLKEYETSAVVEVINMMLDREGEIAHPLSYMRKVLSENHPKRLERDGRREPSRKAGPDTERRRERAGDTTSQMSAEMRARIRRSASPSVNYDFVEPEEDA